MKKTILIILFFLHTTFSFSQKSADYFDNLKKGKYNIGFKRIYSNNLSRVYFDTCNKKNYSIPRPVVVNIWYPTFKNTGNKIFIKDLITFKSGRNELHFFDSVMTVSQFKLAMLYTYGDRNGESYDSSITQWKSQVKENFSLYFNFQTNALSNAPVVKGKYPVVIYHPGLGGTCDDSFLLCEFLASHGYIVVSGAYQSNECADISIGWNLDVSFNEIDFLVKFVNDKMPYADITKIFGAGHSYGAQAMLAYASVSATPFLGFMIFDNTADYEGTYMLAGFKKLKDRLYPRIKQMTKPLFIVARDVATFRIIDSLKYCDRYYLKVPNMDHNDFTSQGVIAKLMEYNLNKDFLKLKQPYLNYLYQIQTSLDFMESIINQRKFVVNPKIESGNQIKFESSLSGTSRY
jgi:hypothetical protein